MGMTIMTSNVKALLPRASAFATCSTAPALRPALRNLQQTRTLKFTRQVSRPSIGGLLHCVNTNHWASILHMLMASLCHKFIYFCPNPLLLTSVACVSLFVHLALSPSRQLFSNFVSWCIISFFLVSFSVSVCILDMPFCSAMLLPKCGADL